MNKKFMIKGEWLMIIFFSIIILATIMIVYFRWFHVPNCDTVCTQLIKEAQCICQKPIEL